MPGRDIRDEAQGMPADPGMADPSLAEPQPAQDSIQLALDARMQKVAARIVQEDFRAARDAREAQDYGRDAKGTQLTHERWLKDLVDLYFGQREPKETPWKYCSNRSMQIAMAILDTLHARMFPAVWNEDLLKWKAGSTAFTDRVERIEKLMAWWVRVRCKLRDFYDRWTRHSIAFGRVLTESMWDVQLIDKGEMGEPQVDPMTGQPLPPEKLLERLEKSISYIIPEQDIFFQPGATDIQRDSVIIRKTYLYRELEELERDGKLVNVTTPSQEGVRTLKDVLVIQGGVSGGGGSPDEDEELKNIRRRNIPVVVLQWYGGIDLDADGFPEQVRLLVTEEPNEVFLSGIAIHSISKRGMRHLDLTMFEPRLNEPQGLRGMGALEKVKELALEIDAIFNQMTDSNTLSIMRPGFYDPSGSLNAGELKIQPNKWTPVENAANSIYIPEINIPTERLILAIRLVLEFIERLTAASAYVMGKESESVGGSGTATRTQAIVGASNERHAIPVMRMREGAARIVTQHLDLLQVNLPPGLEERVLGPNNQPLFANNELSQDSISGEYEAYQIPDDTLGSKEAQRQLAQMMYTLLLQNYLVMSDPTKVYTVTADFMKAWGQDPVRVLGPAPDINQADTPADENSLILAGDHGSVRASPVDNPMEHILEHQSFLQSPAVAMLEPMRQQEIIQFVTAHIQEHMQMMALVMAASQQKGSQPGGSQSNGTKGTPGRAGQPASPLEAAPGMGSVSSPLAAALNGKRAGESGAPA